jgi:hypothetical protein
MSTPAGACALSRASFLRRAVWCQREVLFVTASPSAVELGVAPKARLHFVALPGWLPVVSVSTGMFARREAWFGLPVAGEQPVVHREAVERTADAGALQRRALIGLPEWQWQIRHALAGKSGTHILANPALSWWQIRH